MESQRNFGTFRVKNDHPVTIMHPANPGHRYAATSGQRLDVFSPFGRRAKQQLVIVTSTQDRPDQFGISTEYGARGPRERNARSPHLAADARTPTNVAQIGHQAIRDIDARARDPA